jgi:hypothetical protein
MGVESVSSTVSKMLGEAEPIRDIIKGGAHMRSRGEVYLPKFPMESAEDYKSRKDSTWLFNGVKKARDDISGRVFEKPVVLADQEGPLFEWCQNIDLEGRDLSNFAADVFKASIGGPGISFIMADAPPRGEEVTRGQAEAMGLRPYLVGLSLEQVVGWKWELANNAPVLTQFRIMEEVEDEARDEYSDDTVQQIRVLSLEEGRVAVRLFRKNDKDKWVQHGDDMPTDFPQIYVVPIYTGRTGFFTAEPPLAEIAELNLAHWRVQSDKSNCLHKSLSPLLFMKQMAELGEGGDVVVNSAGFGFTGSSDNADMKWVEITGSGIDAGSNELEEIKDQMKQMGLQLISERIGVSTATGDSIDEGKTVTRIRMWADDLKDAIEIALGWMAEIAGIEAETEVVISKDFGVLGNLPMSDVKDMYLSGVISKKTYIKEAQRRGVLDESVNPDDEGERVETEGLDAEQ